MIMITVDEISDFDFGRFIPWIRSIYFDIRVVLSALIDHAEHIDTVYSNTVNVLKASLVLFDLHFSVFANLDRFWLETFVWVHHTNDRAYQKDPWSRVNPNSGRSISARSTLCVEMNDVSPSAFVLCYTCLIRAYFERNTPCRRKGWNDFNQVVFAWFNT